MPSLPNCRPRSTAARTSASTSFPFLPSPTKTGVPISASGACGGRVPPERCRGDAVLVVVGGVATVSRRPGTASVPRRRRLGHPHLSEINFFHAIISFSTIHVQSWCSDCTISRALQIYCCRMTAAR